MVELYQFCKREWIREFIAELLGTFFLVFLGNNAVAQKVLTHGEGGTVGTLYAGYGMGAFIGVLVSAGVSGAHLNPAVTVAGAFVKKVDWVKVPHYLLGQYLGGFLAACATYLLYVDAFNSAHDEHGATLKTAGIFATYPREGLSVWGGLTDQILGTMVLVVAIYAICDKKNTNVPLYMVPFYVALVIISIGCSIGMNEGFAINPARDFAPRFFTYISCWGGQVFGKNSFWYITIIGPHLGAILGASIYVLFIEGMMDQEMEIEQLQPSPIVNTSSQCSVQIFEKQGKPQSLPQEKANVIPIPAPSEVFRYRL